MKHDSHVLKYKLQFFPAKFFFFSIFAFLVMGIFIGYEFAMAQRIILLD